jgi:glutathione synthase
MENEMNLGIVVNDIRTEGANYSTTRLARAAVNRGHKVWVFDVTSFAYDPDEMIRARAYTVSKTQYKNDELFLKELQSSQAIQERITVSELDILLLRNDPAEDLVKRPWAQHSGITFGRMALNHGVIVLNDPNGLAQAINKSYFQTYPEQVRPATLITRDRTDIKKFAKEYGHIVIKPLQGSGGSGVFMVRPEDIPNMNQMIDAIIRDGFLIAQEYLTAASEGDIRLFVMNGAPLKYKGKYAAFRRVRKEGDLRSNLHAGGTIQQAIITETMLELVEMVRPKLVLDGMFLVGLDIAGDKLMEINVFSPGGLGSAQKFEKVNFANEIIHSLEKKVLYMNYYKRSFSNVDMATL